MTRACALMLVCLSACTGTVEGRAADVPAGAGRPSSDRGVTGERGASMPAGTPGSPGMAPAAGATRTDASDPPAVAGVAWTPRLSRLTHEQYENTVAALFGKPMHASGDFPADLGTDEFDNNAELLSVGDALGKDYRDAAESLAATAVGDAQVWKRLVTCAPGPACAATFIDSFGLQAFRRPLTDAEKKTHVELHGRGAALIGSGDAFKDGVQLVIEAMLQSVDFLYRVELSRTQGADNLIALDDWERASRLSYAIWNSMPDQGLFDTARAGQLRTPEQIAAQVQRMVDTGDPALKAQGRAMVDSFYEQWLDVESYDRIVKDKTLFPSFTAVVIPSLKEETRRFVESALVDRSLGWNGLLTSTSAFVDKNMAALYGLKGTFGTAFAPADLPGTERAGLLTRIGFLAANAHEAQTSPVFRGVFIMRHLLCAPPPPPPKGVDLTPPPLGGDLRTRRQQVARQTTSSQPCQSCHAIINEFGYPFEAYDAAGRVQARDNGVPVDVAATVTLDGKSTPVGGPIELSNALAASEQGRACFASHWLRYLYARPVADGDRPTIDRLVAGLGGTSYRLRDLLTEVATSKAFGFRAPDAP